MSCNLLSPKLLVDQKTSDNQSEVSEAGTCTSGWNSNWDSREQLRDLVTKLGLNDEADLFQDRFKVDRKKLEQMLSGDSEALIPADVFFETVMNDTDTLIIWPNKLKIGAKSKKDPHVRIAGRPIDVAAAKERILTILNTRCNRITLKMEVSYTDHSHIIGKGGNTIKRVMEQTQCHVHFPDSNRTNPTEKSNQVSISGDIEGVENARSRVRELIPLIFGFELPIMLQKFDSNSPYVVHIQEQYKVQVIFRTRPKLHASLVLVKGVEWEIEQVKQATILLIDFMCDKLANQTQVQMWMEISPHHHQTVLGKNHSNLKAIMQYTNCQIMFPDAQDPNIPNLKKSYVTISGNINQVYQARQLLMGSLPILIIFDLPEDTTNLRIRPEQIMEIQNQCDLVINIRQKAKQITKICIVRGIEKHVVNIYKARNMILGINEPPIPVDIPATYHLPSPVKADYCNDVLSPPSLLNSSPINSPMGSPRWQYASAPSTSKASFVSAAPQPQTAVNPMQSLCTSGYNSLLPQKCFSMENSNYFPTSNANLCSDSIYSQMTATSPSNINRENSPSNKSTLSSIAELGESFNVTPEKKSFWNNKLPSPNDYENKRLAGLRAMEQKPTPGVLRTPTNAWSGYGISYSSPAGFLSESGKAQKEHEMWHNTNYDGVSPNLNKSNILDRTPSHLIKRIANSNWTDMTSLLTSIGLDERYVKLMNNHEIDLQTFATLNEEDLEKIGVNAFGARKRMLLAITELNKRFSCFSPAPGAERKSSPNSSPVNPHGNNW